MEDLTLGNLFDTFGHQNSRFKLLPYYTVCFGVFPSALRIDLPLEGSKKIIDAILTHMDQSMDYASLLARLPAGVEPGHAGLETLL